MDVLALLPSTPAPVLVVPSRLRFKKPVPFPSAPIVLRLEQKGHEKDATDFRFVLMWPTWPQLAHFLAVPSLLRPLALCGVLVSTTPSMVDAGPSMSDGPGDAAAAVGELAAVGSLCLALSRSRASLLSRLRLTRASSFSSSRRANASLSESPVGTILFILTHAD